MKVFFDYQTFCLQSYGGISRYFFRLNEEMPKFGIDAKIVAPVHRNRYLSQGGGSNIGFFIKKYPPKTTRLILGANVLLSNAFLSFNRADLIHETYYSDVRVGAKGVPRILTVYDMIHEVFQDKFFTDDKTTSNEKRRAVNRADHVICISESTRSDLVNLFGVPVEKTSVVHLGFDSFSEMQGVCDNNSYATPYILYVGNRGGYKNFTAFVAAFAASPRLRGNFNIIAFGGGRFSKGELECFHKYGLGSDQIIQISGGDDLLGQLYRNAQAFVYPSLYEGFGLPPLEAMANNCPVISSNTSSMPEIIAKAARYFDPTSIDEMKISMEDVLFSSNIRNELVSEGAERLAEFSWTKCAKKTAEVYRMFKG